jgi:hypothetical protein
VRLGLIAERPVHQQAIVGLQHEGRPVVVLVVVVSADSVSTLNGSSCHEQDMSCACLPS